MDFRKGKAIQKSICVLQLVVKLCQIRHLILVAKRGDGIHLKNMSVDNQWESFFHDNPPPNNYDEIQASLDDFCRRHSDQRQVLA